MKKHQKKHKAKSFAWAWLGAAVVALLLGIGIGAYTDPLPPSVCAARLAQLNAPPGVDSFVCYGRRPN